MHQKMNEFLWITRAPYIVRFSFHRNHPLFATTLQGFYLGLAMIIPIGAQNAFVLSRGIHRNHHLLTATLCLCDPVPDRHPGCSAGQSCWRPARSGWPLLTWGGVLFLGWSGIRSRAVPGAAREAALADSPRLMGVKSVLAMTLESLCNPSTWIPLMLLGLFGQFALRSSDPPRGGAMLASGLVPTDWRFRGGTSPACQGRVQSGH